LSGKPTSTGEACKGRGGLRNVKARPWIKNENENSLKGKMYFHQSTTTYMYFLYVHACDDEK
jgi:hypothetical protein